MATADDLICAALRGERVTWPWPDEGAPAAFLQSAAMHGVQPLLNTLGNTWPPPIVDALRKHAIARAMWELRHQQTLAETLGALSDAGVIPVLVKGTALAYSLYADPALRTRGDTDLVIPVAQKALAAQVLQALGYTQPLSAGGELTSYQASFTRQAPEGGTHTLDVHWKINNSEVLSRLFSYEELRAQARPLPSLSPHAIGAGDVHALLIACMHRATHRHNPYYVDGLALDDPDRLIWLYDIHLLAQRFTPAQWDQFTRLADAKGLRAVCLEGLARSRACLGTTTPASVRQALSAPGNELPDAYLRSNSLRQHWMDWRALGAWKQRCQKLRELLFPAADYMRHKYAGARMHWLPWLYLRRAAGGVLNRVGAGRPPA